MALGCAVRGSPQASPAASVGCQYSSAAGEGQVLLPRRGRGAGTCSTTLPDVGRGMVGCGSRECGDSCLHRQPSVISLSRPLPGPQTSNDRLPAAQPLADLLRHLHKGPSAPRTLSTKDGPRRGQESSILSGSGVSQGLISKRTPACPVSAWSQSSSWHILPSTRGACTPCPEVAQRSSLG